MIKPNFFISFIVSLGMSNFLFAQSYHAINGSPYSGSTSRFINPASPVNNSYLWEFSPVSFQVSISSNSLLIDTGAIRVRVGLMNHFIHANSDIGLINGMIKLNSKWAISGGIRARFYNHYRTQPVNIVDTTSSLFSFLQKNRTTPYIGGYITHNAWLEGDLNVSTLLFANDEGRLSAGITLQLMKGISGAYLNLKQITYQEFTNGIDTSYFFTGGSGRFGYSAIYEPGTTISNFNDVMSKSLSSIGTSLGIEYIRYNSQSDDKNENKLLNYKWKLGISILDIGANKYQYATPSRNFSDLKPSITDAMIDNKTNGAGNLPDLIDSVSTIFNTNTQLTGNFSISLPTKLILNFDKQITGHFYLNALFNLNLLSDESPLKWRTREINQISITPRWENDWLGIYLPLQLTAQGETWMGAAIKVGPFTIGVHNFEFLTPLLKMPNVKGGGYLLFSIHPFNRNKKLNNFNCWQ